MLLTVLLRLTPCAGWRQPCATCPGTTIAPFGPSPWPPPGPPPPGPPPPPGGGPHQHPLRVALRAASAAIANSFFILPPSMDLRSRGAAACKRICDAACQWGSYQSTKDHVLRSRYNPRLKDAALYGAHGGQNARCMGHAWRFQCSGEGRSRVHALFGYGSWCKKIFGASRQAALWPPTVLLDGDIANLYGIAPIHVMANAAALDVCQRDIAAPDVCV